MFSLEAKIRTENARETREADLIPGVLYGKDVPSTMIAVGVSEFIKVYRESGKDADITLTVDGKNTLLAFRRLNATQFVEIFFTSISL